jgi:hypothetical protein
MSEFLRSAGSLSMDEAGKLIALVQAPVGSLVEDIDGTRIVLADVPIRTELLILLHGRYPERVHKAELLDSLSRRSSGAVANELRAMVQAKQLHGKPKEGYTLTQTATGPLSLRWLHSHLPLDRRRVAIATGRCVDTKHCYKCKSPESKFARFINA